ncbi:DNA translocase FtsK [Patescibacteria group bacterium]|jgi:S-DNA-T family DNA segregation ATPase FtsK/SpoIIIE|nr:DNA translocase FtsK [Patescibacteria group bacterium]
MGRRKKSSFGLAMEPETRKGVAVVTLFFGALFLLLTFFDMGGQIGQAVNEGVAYVFGWDKLIIPFLLMAWGYHVAAPDRLPLRFSNALGFLLFFLSLNPLIHAVTFPELQPVADAALMVSGGKLGETVALPFVQMLGMPGAVILFVAILVISLLLMFNATLRQVLFVIDLLWKGLALFLKGLWSPIRRWMDARAEAKAQTSLKPLDEMEEEAEGEDEEEGEEEGEEEEAEEEEGEEEGDEEPRIAKIKPKKRYPRVEIPFDLLDKRDDKPTSGDIVHNREVIRRTLENFGIPVEMAEVSVGPTVTQFAFKPSDGIKLSRITGLNNDLALALAAHPIRIEAPIPGKSLVGVEVPNKSVATVGLREMFESKEFRERRGSLAFVLGKDVSGKAWTADLAKMPHLLVAGATGSGKSVGLNVLIMSYIYTLGPDDVKFIMVDPKRVELQVYNGIPHLITPVITKVPETVNALKWALREMDRRLDLLGSMNAKDISSYNSRVQDRLPYIVIIIDEMADLMASSASEVEGPIVRLAQMSRAVGIHLVLATQRPSVDVITGLIKANVPGRIAFAVASATDSRTILDQQGAEKLLGRGDMLITSNDIPVPKRLQGAFVSETEISRVVEFVKSKYDPPEYDPGVVERPAGGPTVFGGGAGFEEDSDPLIPDAKEEIIRAGKASASLLQRRLKVGYARAARLLDLLEQEGFIGPGDGAKPREILKADFTKASDPLVSNRKNIAAPEPPPAAEKDEEEEEDGEELEEEEIDEEGGEEEAGEEEEK